MEPNEVAALATEILETHHVFLHREMPSLTKALADAPFELRRTWSELHVLLEDHLMKEEVILFPSIHALAGGDSSVAMHVLGPIPQMKADHESIRRLEGLLREAASTAGSGAPALLALLADLDIHARREDDELFPAALALLPGTPDLEAINAAVEALNLPHHKHDQDAPTRRQRLVSASDAASSTGYWDGRD